MNDIEVDENVYLIYNNKKYKINVKRLIQDLMLTDIIEYDEEVF